MNINQVVRAVILLEPHFPTIPSPIQSIHIVDMQVQNKSGKATMLLGAELDIKNYLKQCNTVLVTNQDTGVWNTRSY